MLDTIARVAVPFSERHTDPQIIIDTRWWPDGPIQITTAVMSGDTRWTIVGRGKTVEAAVADWVTNADAHAPGWSNR